MDPSKLVCPTLATAFAGTSTSEFTDNSRSMCQLENVIFPTLPTTTSSIITGEFDSNVPILANSA
ncbi:hypothetical protein A5761_09865 [Mycolicibacterium setense]|nr:hypothetical protein A5761_09865 [Mycolicibacterium setense]